jgi:DNA-binding PadR family transcriptional regulator
MSPRDFLGEFEQIVLLAVARLGADSYGVTIGREIRERTGRAVAIGAVYATLARLEEKGCLESWQGESTARRGGRAKRHYGVTASGLEALQASRRIMDRMWDGLDGEPRPEAI